MPHVFTESWGCWKPRSTYCSDIFSECRFEQSIGTDILYQAFIRFGQVLHFVPVIQVGCLSACQGSIREDAMNMGGTVKRGLFSPQ